MKCPNGHDYPESLPSCPYCPSNRNSGEMKTALEGETPIRDLASHNGRSRLISKLRSSGNLLIIALLVIIIVIMLINTSQGKSSTSWEYKVLEVEGTAVTDMWPKIISIKETDLDQLGRQGWELCTSIPVIETVFPNFGNEEYHTGIKTNTRTAKVTLIFKRRL